MLIFFSNGHALEFESKSCIMPFFSYKDGWQGADAAYSIELPRKKTLWIFQDTFVGKGKKQNIRNQETKMIGNSIGISSSRKEKEFNISYFWRSMYTEQPGEFFPFKKGFKYWPAGGLYHKGYVYITLVQVGSSEKHGFVYTGVDIAKMRVEGDDPRLWQTQIYSLSRSKVAFPGIGVVKQKNSALFYAVRDGGKYKGEHSLLVGQIKLRDLEELGKKNPQAKLLYLSRKSKYDAEKWTNAAVIQEKGSTEISVHYNKELKTWVMIHGESQFDAKHAVVKFSPNPEGPWSSPQRIFEYPEMLKGDRKYGEKFFCYAAKAHKAFSLGTKILLTYVCNVRLEEDDFTPLMNMDIYRPQSIIIDLKDFFSKARL